MQSFWNYTSSFFSYNALYQFNIDLDDVYGHQYLCSHKTWLRGYKYMGMGCMFS